jgi:hypothetical protein
VRYCEKETLYLVVGCESNAHHTEWGRTNCKSKGEALLEFLNTTNLEILHRENETTLCTLGSLRLLEIIIDWEVSSEP